MKINRDNYEAYFLDYHEGQLSLEMAQEVLLFVEQNPDLRFVFAEFEVVSLSADQDIVFEKKSSLKKNQVFATSQVNELNYEEYLVAETEGLLNSEQIESLDEFISINPQFETDRRLYAVSHLPVENSIVFENKESLKHKAIPVGLINEETFETYFARETDDDLNQDEKNQLVEFMQYNPHLERDRKLYSHTLLEAESDIVFADKNKLKRSIIPLRLIVYYALSAAASLALIFSVYFLLERNSIDEDVAQIGKIKSKTNKVITEPEREIPDNKVAVNMTPSEDVSFTPDRHKQVSPVTTAETKIVNEESVNTIQNPIAYNQRSTVEALLSKSVMEVTTPQFVDPQFTFIRVSQMYMNQNLELYYNLKLSEQIQYAQVNSKDKNPAKTIFDAATGRADELLALNRNTTQREEKKNLSMWTFAELGVQTFNTITSGELELNLKKDDEGKVIGYGLQSSLIDYEKNLKK